MQTNTSRNAHSRNDSKHLSHTTVSQITNELLLPLDVPAPPVRFRSETVGKRRMLPQLSKVKNQLPEVTLA